MTEEEKSVADLLVEFENALRATIARAQEQLQFCEGGMQKMESDNLDAARWLATQAHRLHESSYDCRTLAAQLREAIKRERVSHGGT